MWRTWWCIAIVIAGCGDNAGSAIDGAVPDTSDATIPDEATAFVMGAAPACSSASSTTNACLAQAAASAWGSCTTPEGWNLLSTVEASLPAVAVSGDNGNCTVLAIVDTACGPAAVSWMMGNYEKSWAAFQIATAQCWMASFGRVCAAFVPTGMHAIEYSSCTAGFYSCFATGYASVTVSASGVSGGFEGGGVSGCFPGTPDDCHCW